MANRKDLNDEWKKGKNKMRDLQKDGVTDTDDKGSKWALKEDRRGRGTEYI